MYVSPAEQPASRTIEVWNIGADCPKVESVTTTTPDVIRARLLPPRPVTGHGPDGGSLLGHVEVTLTPQPPGGLGGEVVLKLVSESRTRTVTLPVTANISQAVTVSPLTGVRFL